MAKIVSIASGKGGVGKSFLAANLAMSMVSKGYRVLLVDGDLGGANLHNFIGLKAPGKGLYNFLRDKSSLADVTLESSAGVHFIGGSGDVLGMAHINNFEKLKILNQLKRTDYEYAILDLGAGTSYNMVDFFNFSDKRVLVMTSEPTSIENSYGFLKVALYRKIERLLIKDKRMEDICKKLRSRSMNYPKVADIIEEVDGIDPKATDDIERILKNYNVGLVLNMLKFKKELNIFFGFEKVTEKYLSITIEKLGFVPYDITVGDHVKNLKPYYIAAEKEQKLYFDEIRDFLVSSMRG